MMLTNTFHADPRPVLPGSAGCAKASARRGFSLVELVIVLVIIGIIAAIAVPRFSSATEAAHAKTVAGTLRIVNGAMELYKADHGYYPGLKPDGTMYPTGMFVNELLAPSSGATPYLRGPGFPTNPFNNLSAASRDLVDPASDPGPFGWFVNLSTGSLNINLWKSVVPADFDLCDLISAASPALISYDHPGAAACGGS